MTTPTVLKLGSAQTLAWASSYYLPAILTGPIANDLGIAPALTYGAFSLALITSGLLAPLAGRTIDRLGGRPVLMLTNGLFALALVTLGSIQGPIGLFIAWFLMGVGMSAGLYEAAFATLVRLYGSSSRNSITGITLIAGFASTVGWPLSTYLEVRWGWRATCYTWAVLHLLIGLPLNAWLPRASAAPAHAVGAGAPAAARDEPPPLARPRMVAMLLAFVFTVTAFVATAMAAHLPRLMQAAGATLAVAVAAGMLIGPAQVGGRLLEFGLLRRMHPLLSTRLAALAHPLGVAGLLLFGAPAAMVFAILHGAGNGILTISRGTLPLSLFGPRGYGALQGMLSLPGRFAQASAPLLFGLALDAWGARALWVSALLWMSGFVALLLLPRPRD